MRGETHVGASANVFSVQGVPRSRGPAGAEAAPNEQTCIEETGYRPAPKSESLTEGHQSWLQFGPGLLGIATMITFLDGTLVLSLPTQAVVDVRGVGYEISIPLSSYDKLPAVGQPVRILTHLHVREDAHILYGFMTAPERDLFRLLVNNVSGIGPKLALAVLSGMSVASFKSAVVNADTASLAKISGLGKKTAERIVLELKDKLGVVAAWEVASAAHAPSAEQTRANEAVLALISLGYKQVDAHKTVREAQAREPTALTVEDLVKSALKKMASGR
jgi:Holliday junction DNA helicase RuvA